VPEGQTGRWFDGDPFSAAEGEVQYLGDRRIRLDVGGHRHEVMIRDRMARVWETKRTTRTAPIVQGRCGACLHAMSRRVNAICARVRLITAGARVLALKAIDVLGLSDEQ